APVADIGLLARSKVMIVNATTFLVGWAMIGAFILTPQLLEAPKSTSYGFGLNAAQAGLLILPGTIMGLVWGPGSARIGARFGNKVPLALGGFISYAGFCFEKKKNSETCGSLSVTLRASVRASAAYAPQAAESNAS